MKFQIQCTLTYITFNQVKAQISLSLIIFHVTMTMQYFIYYSCESLQFECSKLTAQLNNERKKKNQKCNVYGMSNINQYHESLFNEQCSIIETKRKNIDIA